MAEELFDIYFSGKLMPDHDLGTVRAAVGKIFKASEQVLDQLFSGKSVKIKKSVDMDTAIKYRVKFREVGALVDIRPCNPNSPGSPSVKPATPAKPVQPPTNSLSPVGAVLDETPAVPAVDIDTTGLTAAEANSGSLEEFAEPVAAAPLPDISQMDFGSDEGPLDVSPIPAEPEIDISTLAIDNYATQLDDSMPAEPANIDTSNLSAAAANSGSLEAFNSRPKAVPLPDISSLEILKD